MQPRKGQPDDYATTAPPRALTRLPSLSDTQLFTLFDELDTDKSGTLDQKELEEALKDEEIRSYLQINQSKIDEAFAKMDELGTGEVTWEQFEKYFQV